MAKITGSDILDLAFEAGLPKPKLIECGRGYLLSYGDLPKRNVMEVYPISIEHIKRQISLAAPARV